MSKAADMGKVSAKGSFHLLWGIIASTVISSVGTIFIARLLGSDLYGLYGVVLIVPGIIGMFRDWGVNSAMVRCAAQYRVEGRASEIRNVFVSGVVFELVLGLILSLIAFVLSGVLANVFNRPEIAPLIQLVSISILASGLINAASAAFTGIERMELSSVMLICQSLIKTVLIIALVSPIFGLGTYGAVIGYTVGAVVAGLIGVFLIWTLFKGLPKPMSPKLEIKAYITAMLIYGIPLSVAGMIGGVQIQFYSFLLPIFYTNNNSIMGNYGIAMNFVVLITFFATPITTMLFPAFSKLDPKKDKDALKNVFQLSIKYASLLVVPATVIVMSLAEPAVSTIFGVSYGTAPLFLALLAISYLYTAFGSLTAGNLIISQGETNYNLKLTLITATIGFPLGAVLILTFGVMGLILVMLTAGLPSLFLSLRWVRKTYGVSVEWGSSAKILLSSALAGVVTYVLVSELSFSSWLRLIIGVIVFLCVFVFAALLTRTINRYDIGNIRLMVSGIGPLGKIINPILKFIEKIMIALGYN